MKLAWWHRQRGDTVHLDKRPEPGRDEPSYDRVYGSAIFSHSRGKVARLLQAYPGAVVGGTWDATSNHTVEQHLGVAEFEHYDYSVYPQFEASICFTQRGCRLRCGFCVVPRKEGRPRPTNTIASLWRGEPWPKHLHLLDNDFFGQPRDQWEARIGEIIDDGFKVCLNQGINIRMVDEDSAKALAAIPYFDDSFKTRRLYTAWDNIGDEERFFRGVARLEEHGIPPRDLFVYMLVGYDPRETWERVFYRFDKMLARGVRPFPMVFGDRARRLPLGSYPGKVEHLTLGHFQRWVVRRLNSVVRFEDYDPSARSLPLSRPDRKRQAAALRQRGWTLARVARTLKISVATAGRDSADISHHEKSGLVDTLGRKRSPGRPRAARKLL